MSGYIVALLATAAAEMFRHVLYGVSGNAAPFLPFTLAVLVTAWMGGLRPGLLATALGTVLSLFLFVSPQISFAPAGVSQMIGAVRRKSSPQAFVGLASASARG